MQFFKVAKTISRFHWIHSNVPERVVNIV